MVGPRRSALINVMAGAALKAAKGLIRDFGEVEQLQVSIKGPGEFVSAADLKAEKILRAELAKARPGYGFLLEEGGTVKGSDVHHRWIVDPLDGTTNFLHGIPQWAISIALERDGEIVAGLVYEPIRDEAFWAEKGVGAFVNDRRLRVSARRQMGEAVIGTGLPFRERGDHPTYLKTLAAVMAATSGVRRPGSAALDLAYVAAGRYEGFWEFGLQPWDIAAGILLVREAGGHVTDIGGGNDALKTGNILATNDNLQGPLTKLIRDSLPSPTLT
ncbi:MAG TPA: inositol monophosphatase family protein [Stellaceae bacterium]|jgi:myo-inositol-1(or 4)-monophosphatase|nr:inositol monophosphatase family protein [Stellaceae bacterium]